MSPHRVRARNQFGFFHESGELRGSHPQFSEICTALYERELFALSHSAVTNLSVLQRRVGGLPHHVRSVARYMVMVKSGEDKDGCPLDIDPHNGSWFARQTANCPGAQAKDNEKQKICEKWYLKNAAYGLVVPVLVKNIEGLFIELDSIDMVNQTQMEIHLNKYGWFTASGISLAEYNASSYDASNGFLKSNSSSAFNPLSTLKLTLLKPTKLIMTSACCGHAWSYKSRRSPRALTLREMRLSTRINWKNFTLPHNF